MFSCYFNNILIDCFIIFILILNILPMGNCQDSPNLLTELGTQQSQPHLMNHWKNLPSNNKRRTFEEQLYRANVQQALKIYKKSSHSSGRSTSRGSSFQSEHSANAFQYRPLPPTSIMIKQTIKEMKEELDAVGLNAIKNEEAAVFIMAASHSTQLKIDMPLGVYDIGLDSACAMLQLLLFRLMKLNQICGLGEMKRIKVYIMTSSQNKEQIKNYFKKNNYFGYGSKNIFFFSQSVQPILDQHGKIVLKSEDNIYLGPRGNGCIYLQIKQKKLIDHLQSQGVKYCFLCPINNILLKISDPCTLGYLIQQKQEVVATCIDSNDDCFGYFGIDSKSKIKVYEEKINSNQRKWANSGSCWMSLEFLRSVANNASFMNRMQEDYHDIIRQATIFNTALNTKCTQKCLFFESFYHQAFSLATNITVVQIYPQEQFAPIKYNGKGKYSLLYAKQSIWKWHRRLVEDAGIKLIGEGHVEIHPALVYEQGQISRKVIKQKIKEDQLKLPVLIR